ncbi:MAG: GTPase Era [Candidatus Cloacimonadaceae bacterium]
MKDYTNHRSGFATIFGKPNTGKSTLMNRILGEKLSITSPKPQTTRYAVKGILNTDDEQIIFIDTPGFLKPRYEMQERMAKIIDESFKDVDLLIFMSHIQGFPSDYDMELLSIVEKARSPVIAVMNKLDINPEYDADEILKHLPENVEDTLFVSAKTGEGIHELITKISSFMPLHPPYYDEEQLSDLPLRFFAKELIREAIFHNFRDEIPYSTAVLIERYEEREEIIVIRAVIWIERNSQKHIIIGRGGSNLKKIREYAEEQFSEFVDFPVRIHLHVKVNENWRKKGTALKELGFY